MANVERQPFEFFKVSKVAEYRHGYDDAYCETIDDERDQESADEAGAAQFWSVYGHRQWPEDEYGVVLLAGKGYGTTAIADLTTYEDALDLAIALAGGDEGRVRL